jgi:hypothetical protein
LKKIYKKTLIEKNRKQNNKDQAMLDLGEPGQPA